MRKGGRERRREGERERGREGEGEGERVEGRKGASCRCLSMGLGWTGEVRAALLHECFSSRSRMFADTTNFG